MSGKSTLCYELLNMRRPSLSTTSCCYYLAAAVNNVEWHVWDTPAVECPDDIYNGWPGEHVLQEADVVLVCHDGRYTNPMQLVQACGTDRCILVLTKTESSSLDVSYYVSYMQTAASGGFRLVPRVRTRGALLAAIVQIAYKCT